MDFRAVYPNELYHHGIKGQKWGVRRFQNKDGSLTPVGKERYSKNNQPKEKGINLLTAYYAAVFAFAFGPGVVKAIHNDTEKKNAEKFVKKCDEERNAAPIDKKSGLKLKSTNLDEKEDIRRVNPQYGVDRRSLGESTGATSNCVNCTMALEMRKRGFEVQAKLNNTTMTVTPAAVEEFFNISRATNIPIWRGCCQTVTVRNTSDIPILVENPNIIFSRPDLAVTY